MIQIQDWKCDKKIIVVDEINHGTVRGGTEAWTL